MGGWWYGVDLLFCWIVVMGWDGECDGGYGYCC